MNAFDTAADFLLDMQWPNLFERADATPGATLYRCKGCGEVLPQSEQQRHYRREQSARDARRAARRAEIEREGAKRLRALSRERRVAAA